MAEQPRQAHAADAAGGPGGGAGRRPHHTRLRPGEAAALRRTARPRHAVHEHLPHRGGNRARRARGGPARDGSRAHHARLACRWSGGGAGGDGVALYRPDTRQHGAGAGAPGEPAARRGDTRHAVVGPDQHRPADAGLGLAESQRQAAAAAALAQPRVPGGVRADDGGGRPAQHLGGAPADRAGGAAGRSR